MGNSIKIPGRLESAETGNIVAGADAIKDDVRGKTQYVVNNELEAAILQLGESKQNKLTFDQTPTEDSPNPVTSGGVYAADQLLSQAIEAILLLIPSAASALNKLVDMATMNSSIATATASFKGTYNLVSDLHLSVDATHAQIAAALDALSLDADNNDYAFVQIPNTGTAPTEIAKTERYKFNGENWAYEYDLNNSGFTQAQWNAINSGITTLLVSKLSALPTNEALVAALEGKQDNLTFDNVPTAGSPNPVKSGGIYTRNNEIVALINALDAVKQDVLTFDTTPTIGSPNPVTSNGIYLAIQLVQTAVVALDGRMSTDEIKISTAETNIVNLQAAYSALTQSDIVVVEGALPSSGQQQNVIYRQPDPDHTPPQFYSDYMWNGTAWVLMATYNNAIDDVPTLGSNNLVKSGGVYEHVAECYKTLSSGEIQQVVQFTEAYHYSIPDIIPIPAGAEIIEISGAGTDVYGQEVKDILSPDSFLLVVGTVVPFQINYLKARNYTGQLTIKYKTTALERADSAIDIFYNSFTESKNLANPKDFIEGYYVSYLDGNLWSNQSYNATGYIPVIGGQSYYISFKHQIAWYDRFQRYISGSSSTDTTQVQVAPNNAKYLRCSIKNEYVDSFIVAEGTSVVPFEPYGDKLKNSAIAPRSISPDKIQLYADNEIYLNRIGSISSDTMLETTDFPLYAKKGLAICFYGKITSFDTLYIGKGYNKYRGRWVKITTSDIIVERYESNVITVVTQPHGLSLSTFVKLNIVQNDDGTSNIILQTLGGQYELHVSEESYEWNQELFIRSSGTVLSEAVLNATIKDIEKKVWIFGDSYLGVTADRVIGQLKNIGLFDYLVDGLAGATSPIAYADLQRMLAIGKPQYLVWCLGMNDSDENFTTYFNNVKTLCQENGIVMIGCTIPSVPNLSKETISNYVRSSGLRYVDAYKAVGTNSTGDWYDGYLSSDNVHPTAKGAKAIALQWTIDFPELYIYCRYIEQ